MSASSWLKLMALTFRAINSWLTSLPHRPRQSVTLVSRGSRRICFQGHGHTHRAKSLRWCRAAAEVPVLMRSRSICPAKAAAAVGLASQFSGGVSLCKVCALPYLSPGPWRPAAARCAPTAPIRPHPLAQRWGRSCSSVPGQGSSVSGAPASVRQRSVQKACRMRACASDSRIRLSNWRGVADMVLRWLPCWRIST
jgi:hypothetical protein